MFEPFAAAIRSDPKLAHADFVHDPFHVMKRAGQAVNEVRALSFDVERRRVIVTFQPPDVQRTPSAMRLDGGEAFEHALSAGESVMQHLASQAAPRPLTRA